MRQLAVFAASTAFVAVAVSPLLAFEQKDVEKLKETRACAGCDLSDANLSRANLSGATLNSANLSDANLSRANLSDATLLKANLDGATLLKANLSGAKMRGALLCNTTMPDGHVEYSGCR